MYNEDWYECKKALLENGDGLSWQYTLRSLLVANKMDERVMFLIVLFISLSKQECGDYNTVYEEAIKFSRFQ